MPLDIVIQGHSRATNRLSAIKVAKLKEPGLYEDGAGLRLVVTDAGVKRWVLRVTINGHRVERGLGVWPGVSLEDARRKSISIRTAAKDGRDASAEQASQRALRSQKRLMPFSRSDGSDFQMPSTSSNGRTRCATTPFLTSENGLSLTLVPLR
jgi:hypothetical protein